MDVREKLVELLGADICKYNYCEDCECFENEEECFATINYSMADHLISHGVTVQEWISVKDRVPKNSGHYLVMHRNKHTGSTSIAIETYIKCKIGEWWSNDYVYDVTHWMPLPKPLKGE